MRRRVRVVKTNPVVASFAPVAYALAHFETELSTSRHSNNDVVHINTVITACP